MYIVAEEIAFLGSLILFLYRIFKMDGFLVMSQKFVEWLRPHGNHGHTNPGRLAGSTPVGYLLIIRNQYAGTRAPPAIDLSLQ